MTKKIGIIGGMGPAAGCDLYDKMLALTPAKCDQEHIHVILDSNINIPDRTDYIMDNEKLKLQNGQSTISGGAPIIPEMLEKHVVHDPVAQSPLPEIQKSAKLLESVGCDALSMPCVTAHYHEEEIINCVDIPFISITEAVATTLSNRNAKKASIMVTDGSLCGQIFRPHLEKHNIEPVYPTMEEQKLIMDLIYKYVKHGNHNKIYEDYENVQKMLNHFREQGADAHILGCTEIPIAFELLGINDEDIVDSTLELAKATVEFATH